MRNHRWCLGGLLLLLNGAIHAGDLDDAQLAQQCPGAVAWIAAQKQKVPPAPKSAAKPTEPALRAELLKMAQADEQARNAWIADNYKHPALGQAVVAVDKRNRARIKQIVVEQGFPVRRQVGSDGVEAAWRLVQHADADPGFQRYTLKELRPLVKSGDIRGDQYAMLTDRVLRAQHKPQRYGSQFDGQMHPQPMEDPANVDKRRAEVGLMPMADYACVIKMTYHPAGH